MQSIKAHVSWILDLKLVAHIVCGPSLLPSWDMNGPKSIMTLPIKIALTQHARLKRTDMSRSTIN